jgi:hypothetical protein
MLSRPPLDNSGKIRETEKAMSKDKLPPEVLEFFRKQGSKGGKMGGSKAWENLTADERSARAKKAVAAREAKRAAAKSTEVRSKKAAAKKKPERGS